MGSLMADSKYHAVDTYFNMKLSENLSRMDKINEKLAAIGRALDNGAIDLEVFRQERQILLDALRFIPTDRSKMKAKRSSIF